jgi:hypothetical protein
MASTRPGDLIVENGKVFAIGKKAKGAKRRENP